MARTTRSIISFETQRVANGKRAARHRSSSVQTLRNRSVSQTIRSRGGTFLSASKRSRQVWWTSAEKQKKMLILSNEQFPSCFQASGEPEVTFDGRIRFDGFATVKTCL